MPEVTGEDGRALGPCLFMFYSSGELGLWFCLHIGPELSLGANNRCAS